MAASGHRPRGALSATYRWAREGLGPWRTLRADSVKYPLCAALRLDEGRYTTTVTHVVGLTVTYVPDRSVVAGSDFGGFSLYWRSLSKNAHATSAVFGLPASDVEIGPGAAW